MDPSKVISNPWLYTPEEWAAAGLNPSEHRSTIEYHVKKGTTIPSHVLDLYPDINSSKVENSAKVEEVVRVEEVVPKETISENTPTVSEATSPTKVTPEASVANEALEAKKSKGNKKKTNKNRAQRRQQKSKPEVSSTPVTPQEASKSVDTVTQEAKKAVRRRENKEALSTPTADLLDTFNIPGADTVRALEQEVTRSDIINTADNLVDSAVDAAEGVLNTIKARHAQITEKAAKEVNIIKTSLLGGEEIPSTWLNKNTGETFLLLGLGAVVGLAGLVNDRRHQGRKKRSTAWHNAFDGVGAGLAAAGAGYFLAGSRGAGYGFFFGAFAGGAHKDIKRRGESRNYAIASNAVAAAAAYAASQIVVKRGILNTAKNLALGHAEGLASYIAPRALEKGADLLLTKLGPIGIGVAAFAGSKAILKKQVDRRADRNLAVIGMGTEDQSGQKLDRSLTGRNHTPVRIQGSMNIRGHISNYFNDTVVARSLT